LTACFWGIRNGFTGLLTTPLCHRFSAQLATPFGTLPGIRPRYIIEASQDSPTFFGTAPNLSSTDGFHTDIAVAAMFIASARGPAVDAMMLASPWPPSSAALAASAWSSRLKSSSGIIWSS
jgi:hypothetical protein